MRRIYRVVLNSIRLISKLEVGQVYNVIVDDQGDAQLALTRPWYCYDTGNHTRDQIRTMAINLNLFPRDALDLVPSFML